MYLPISGSGLPKKKMKSWVLQSSIKTAVNVAYFPKEMSKISAWNVGQVIVMAIQTLKVGFTATAPATRVYIEVRGTCILAKYLALSKIFVL